ncbi:MAG: hypothetical protein IPO26_21230 [Saprospiraceae bacterium]|nr:hypothetical protein [Saprospiraceae bacterium]
MFSSSQRLIMGTVWDDTNHDGIRTENEKLMPDISVELKNNQLQVVKTSCHESCWYVLCLIAD